MGNTVGIDVGYSAVKALCGSKRVLFPSVVGTPAPEKTYSLTGNGIEIAVNGEERYTPIGNTALLHSQYASGRRDSSWVESKEWRKLFFAALSELSDGAPYETFNVVVGLPVDDYNQYADSVKARTMGRVEYRRRGRQKQTVSIDNVRVITQPYGSLLDKALSDDGSVIDNKWSSGKMAVVDLGGNTMNLLVTDYLEEVKRWTTSNEFGLLHALDSVRDRLRREHHRFNPDTHEVSEFMAAGEFKYRGEMKPIWQYAKDYIEPLIDLVMTSMDNKWPEASRYDATLLTGGGAAAIGKYLKHRMSDYANVEIAYDPRWANVRGYEKLARKVFG